MFDQKASLSQHNFENQTDNLTKNIYTLKDSITSLSHRLSAIENNISTKIQRKQCLEILDKKVNVNQIKKLTEQLNNKFAEEKKKEEEKINNVKHQQQEQIKKLIRKLTTCKTQQKQSSNDIISIKPQQLYLESNETMFSMVVDEIAKLKELYKAQQGRLQQKHKSTIRLNNQVCSKIQNLEKEIEQGLKIKMSEFSQNPKLQSTWSITDKKTKKMIERQKSNDSFDSLRMTMVGKNMENLQRQLSQKLNIKDLLPIIKKNISPLTEEVKQMKVYLEQSMESTKKILVHQSEINQELCTASRFGYWQSFEQKEGLAIWHKEITNLFPEGFIYREDQNSILVNQAGLFLIKVYGIEDEIQWVIINEEEKQFSNSLIMRIEKGTKIKVPSSGDQIVLCVQKL